MAADVDDLLQALQRQLLEHLDRTGAGRVQQQLVKALLQPRLSGQVLGQVGGEELHVAHAVVFGVQTRPRHQPGVPLHPDHRAVAGRARQRQGEVAQPAEQVQHALARLHVQQVQRAGDHRLVQLGIDLDEIERAEQQFHVPLRQPERQLRRLAAERMHGIVAAWLQEDGEPMRLPERGKLRPVRLGQRLQVPEHQRDGGIAGDEFDLRDVAARFHAVHQRAQRVQLEAQLRNDGMAFAQVGDETRVGFAEAHQRLVLLFHPPHRQAALAPIAPGLPTQRRQHRGRRHVADALQVVQQHLLLGFDLPVFGQMLQHAAGADAEMRAARRHAVRRCGEHFQRLRLVEVLGARGLLHGDGFTRQRTGNEHGLAGLRVALRPAGDATPIVGEMEDVEGLGGLVEAGHGA